MKIYLPSVSFPDNDKWKNLGGHPRRILHAQQALVHVQHINSTRPREPKCPFYGADLLSGAVDCCWGPSVLRLRRWYYWYRHPFFSWLWYLEWQRGRHLQRRVYYDVYTSTASSWCGYDIYIWLAFRLRRASRHALDIAVWTVCHARVFQRTLAWIVICTGGRRWWRNCWGSDVATNAAGAASTRVSTGDHRRPCHRRSATCTWSSTSCERRHVLCRGRLYIFFTFRWPVLLHRVRLRDQLAAFSWLPEREYGLNHTKYEDATSVPQ